MNKGKRAETWVRMLRDAGVPIDSQTRILDLGCGAGRLVEAGRAQGFNFYGAGVNMHDAHHKADPALVQEGILRPIEMDPYHIPYPDCFFDAAISDQVFEHVMDYPTTLRELHRVLKPGGAFLHSFPEVLPPTRTTRLRAACLHFPAALVAQIVGAGQIRNQFQKKLNASETCAANYKYLTSHTNYLPKRQLRREFSRYFTDVDFVEEVFLRNSRRGAQAYRLTRWVPFLPQLYSAFRTRAAFGRRALSASGREPAQSGAERSRITPPSAVAARTSAPCR